MIIEIVMKCWDTQEMVTMAQDLHFLCHNEIQFITAGSCTSEDKQKADVKYEFTFDIFIFFINAGH
jgi:hypothetical protein